TLINGAYTLPEYDRYEQGWGRLDLHTSLSDFEYFDSYSNSVNLSTGDSWNVTYTIPDKTHFLNATLVWTDYPRTDSAGKDLVNDLDLKLVCPEGNSYFGNDFDNSGNIDTVNNVEQVIFEPCVGGSYKIYVNASNVPEGPQNFALVMSAKEREKPSVVMDYSPDRPVNSSEELNITANFDHDMVSPVNITIELDDYLDVNNQTMSGSGNTWYYDYKVNSTFNGTANVSIAGQDNFGLKNKPAINAQFIIDSEQPKIELNAPLVENIKGPGIIFEFNVTDNLDEDVEWILFINETKHLTGTGTGDIQKGVTDLDTGNYEWNVVVVDHAKNRNVSNSHHFYFEKDPLTCSFTVNKTRGIAPLTVEFNDTSNHSIANEWDFDDGTILKNETKLNHTFTKPGKYQVKLTVFDAFNNIEQKSLYIHAEYGSVNQLSSISPNQSYTNTSMFKGSPDSKRLIESTGIDGFGYKFRSSENKTIQVNITTLISTTTELENDISELGAGVLPNFYYNISVDDNEWYDNVSSVELIVYYNSTKIGNLNIDESTLKLYRYTNHTWTELDHTKITQLDDDFGTVLYS
ncbi:PKD domain-containing protein, partial [Methanosalsum natronophilum]